MTQRALRLAAFALLLGFAVPARAQDVPREPAPIDLPPAETPLPAEGAPPPAEELDDGGDTFTLGIGAAYTPSYEGSDNYVVTPAAALRGRVSGISFQTRGTYLYVDVVPEAKRYKLDLQLGPIAGVRLNRASRIRDTRVRALGKLDEAFELGAFAGLGKNGVLHAYDNISARVDYVEDVSDTHSSHVITPTLEYGTPLSKTFYVALSGSADYAGDGYARTYFGVTPAGAAASGLPAYSIDGGWKSWKIGLTTALSLSGDLRKGLGVFATGSYGKLMGDFKRSPVVAIAGDRKQLFAAVGIGYTF